MGLFEKKDQYMITYEDCGALGSRKLLKAGVDYSLSDDEDYTDLMAGLLYAAKKVNEDDGIYPFARIGMVFIMLDGTISFMFLNGDNIYFLENAREEDDSFELEDIASLFSANDVQVYQIMQQVSDRSFISLGSEFEDFDEQFGLGLEHDSYRCLDLRSMCKVVSEEHYDGEMDRVIYEIGEDFYIEAYNDSVTECREFWIGRHYMNVKHLLTSYDLGDTNYLGLFDEEGNIIIDQQIAERMRDLSEPVEFFFVNNDYKLEMRPIGVEEIEMELAINRENNIVFADNNFLQ